MISTSAFITSIATSLVIFLVIYCVYLILSNRHANTVVYYPARILSGAGTPDITRRRGCQWIRDLWTVNSDGLTSIAGLDAAVYIHFQAACFWILALSALYCAPAIIAVSVTDSYYTTYNAGEPDPNKQLTYSSIDKLAMGNVTPKSNRLWAGLIGAYWVAFVTLAILWRTYGLVVKLRARHFGTKDLPFAAEQYATLVRDIPKAEDAAATEAQVNEFFSRIYGPAYIGATLVPPMGKVTKAGNKLIKMRLKLVHAEAQFEQSKTLEKPEGKRPQVRTKLFGLCGSKVDAIDWYTTKVAELEPKLRERQLTACADVGAAAIVYFTNRQQAAAASQSMHAERADVWQVVPAPEPNDVEWGNLRIKSYERLIRQNVVYAIVFLTIAFYMIPITFISSLTTLDNLRKNLPFLKPVIDIGVIKTVIQAYLPQLALIIFLALLPNLLAFLSKLEGIPAKSKITRAASGKYFYFIIFNVFLGVTLGATLLNSLKQVIKNPTGIVNTLGSSLPQQSSFFISYISLQFLVSKGLELARIVPLLLFILKKKFSCVTDQEVVEAWAPGPLNYLSLVPNDLLIFTLGICYAAIAPLILPFAAAYFMFNWAIMKNQAINVYVPEWESQGRMWPHMHNRMIAALLLAQITFLGFYAIKKFIATVILFPLPILTIVYYFVSHGRYYPTFQVQSLDVASRDSPQAVPTLVALQDAYRVEAMRNPEEVGVADEVGTLPRKPADDDAKVHGLLAQREMDNEV